MDLLILFLLIFKLDLVQAPLQIENCLQIRNVCREPFKMRTVGPKVTLKSHGHPEGE